MKSLKSHGNDGISCAGLAIFHVFVSRPKVQVRKCVRPILLYRQHGRGELVDSYSEHFHFGPSSSFEVGGALLSPYHFVAVASKIGMKTGKSMS